MSLPGDRDIDPKPPTAINAALETARSAAGHLVEALDQLDVEALDQTAWLDACAEIGQAKHALDLQNSAISRVLGLGSAKDRLRQFFLAHLGEVVTNYQLAGVAGTLEWARRVRELGVEEGWEITSGPDDGLKPGTYRLDADEVDADRAARWRLLNTIRRGSGSASDRCLALLQALHPEPVRKEDLAYVARIQEWPRRMRELEEAGWPIVSSNDDPSLTVGSYRLETLDQGSPRQREAIRQRHQILERDNWMCQSCGARPSAKNQVRLQVHHKHHVAHGGTNVDDNLVTLCVPCHAGEHSLAQQAVADELLNPGSDPDR